jgi:hypothetical protein
MQDGWAVVTGKFCETSNTAERDDSRRPEVMTRKDKFAGRDRRQAVAIFTHCGKASVNASQPQARHDSYARGLSSSGLQGAQHMKNSG